MEQVIVLESARDAEAQQLRLHCLSGDDLAWNDGGWSEPLGPRVDAVGDHRLVFRYRNEAGLDWAVDFGRYPDRIADEVLRLASALPLAAADRRWRVLASRLGPVPPISHALRTIMPLAGRKVVAARRLVHPCHVIDRLMMRDRAMALAEIETLLFGTRPSLENLHCA